MPQLFLDYNLYNIKTLSHELSFCKLDELKDLKVVLDLRLSNQTIDEATLQVLFRFADTINEEDRFSLMNLLLPVILKSKILPSILAEKVNLSII